MSAWTLNAVLDSCMLWYCDITFKIQQTNNHRHVLCPQDVVWKWIKDILMTAFNRSGWMLKTQCVSAHLCASHCMKIKILNWSLIPAGLILSSKKHNGRHFKIPPQFLVVTALITMRLQDSKHSNPVGFQFLRQFVESSEYKWNLIEATDASACLCDLTTYLIWVPQILIWKKQSEREPGRLNRAGEWVSKEKVWLK